MISDYASWRRLRLLPLVLLALFILFFFFFIFLAHSCHFFNLIPSIIQLTYTQKYILQKTVSSTARDHLRIGEERNNSIRFAVLNINSIPLSLSSYCLLAYSLNSETSPVYVELFNSLFIYIYFFVLLTFHLG